MGVAFVPLYIKYLGIEAYGLIGIFAVIQAWLALLDFGMKPTLGREMARYTAGAHNAQSIRDLLRSVEFVGFAFAGLVVAGIWAVSGWLAADWVKVSSLSTESVSHAFTIMGVVTAFRLIEDIYVSSIVGLQRQVLENSVTSIMATIRGFGAIGVLIWISPTIEAFFAWHLLVSFMTVTVFAAVVYHALPKPPRRARFSVEALREIGHFAAGMTGITLLVLLLTQLDKILLSRLLSLEAFGYYALAGVVVNALYMLITPICAAFYPRFTELVTRDEKKTLYAAYHQASQLVTVVMGSAAIVMIMFGERLLQFWTADISLTQHVAPILVILAGGTLINGLMWIPYQMQLAHGWTTFAIKVNIVAVIVLVPAILWSVPRFGAIGAAWAWVALNVGYIAIGMHFMYRRLMSTEKWRWYREDLIIPLAAAAGAGLVCKAALPIATGRFGEFFILGLASTCVIAASALATPTLRHQFVLHLPERIKALYAKKA